MLICNVTSFYSIAESEVQQENDMSSIPVIQPLGLSNMNKKKRSKID